MSIVRTLFLAVVALASTAMGQSAFSMLMGGDTPQLVTPAAQASVNSYEEGTPFCIAFSAEIESPWHAYYRNPATVGMPMAATLKAPEGFAVEGPFWKVPTREENASGVSYGYAQPVLVWRVTPAAGAPEQAEFSISSSVQVCSGEGCMPPEDATTTVQLNKGQPTPSPTWNARVLNDVEILGDTPLEMTATQTVDAVQLTILGGRPGKSAYFFSDDNSISPTAEQTVEMVEGGFRLTLPRNDNADPMYPVADDALVGKPLPSLKGILRYGSKHCRVDMALPAASEALPAAPAATPPARFTPLLDNELLALFGSLFLGGLILNLMPCVFPVIGLKIMSFVELGGGSRRKVFLHSCAFVLGVLLSFWVLSLLLIIFSNLDVLAQTPWQQWADVLMADAGAGSRSWAEWMQNEWVVYLILLLLLVMGLSMYGVFEIGVGATGMGQNLQHKKGYSGSFFSGLFVTVVATPCSGPFLGAAMPAAMALQGPMMIAALTFMALGLAFPYIVLGAFPSLVRLLPRPGEWMESLKQGLSFLLLAAAAWFLDIYLAFVDDTQAMPLLLSLVGVCAACWVYGRWCPLYRSKGSRIMGALVALALLGLSVWGSMPQAGASPAPAPQQPTAAYVPASGASPVWNEWSPELMQQAQEDGHPVYVDFTAKWCATCQANKKVAYSQDVYAALEKHGVVLMRADKTKPNPTIDAEMRRLNRSAVPTNALYLPGEPPLITRELLTAPYLLEWLEKHLGSQASE